MSLRTNITQLLNRAGRPLLIGGSVCFFIVLVVRGPLPRSSGDIRALFPHHSPAVAALERMERLFGSSLYDSVIVGVSPTPDDALRERLLNITDALGGLEGVVRVVSPLEGYSFLGLPVRVLSPDRRYGRFLLEVDGTLQDADRAKLNEAIDELVRGNAVLNPLRAGAFYASEAATRTIDSENRRWTPVSAAVLCVATWLVFGDLTVALRVLVAPVLALVWVFGALLLLDIPLTPISQLVPPLLLAIGASYSVYLASRHLYARAKADPTALSGAAASLMLAAGTTVVGFISLLAMNTRAVEQFGIVMSIGTVLACALSLALTPTLMNLSERRTLAAERRLARFEFEVLPLMKGWFMLVFVLTTLLFGTGIPRMTLDTSPLDFLPAGIPERENLDRAAALFPGNNMLALVIRPPAQRVLSEQDLARIALLQREIESLAGVVATTAAADFMAVAKRIAELDGDGSESGVGEVDPFGPPAITLEDRLATRLFVETDLEGRALLALRDKIAATRAVAALIADGFKLEAASRELVMADQSHRLAHGLLLSVVTALALVFLLLYLVLRRFWLAVLGLVPSLLPILVVFGALGYFYERVNLGAAMVAAVSLGMVSDNTFHFLIAWQRCEREQNRVARALDRSVGPFIVTAFVLVAGFSATDFSRLEPMRQFGMFLGLSIGLGVITNGLLLPFMMRCLEKSRDPRPTTASSVLS